MVTAEEEQKFLDDLAAWEATYSESPAPSLADPYSQPDRRPQRIPSAAPAKPSAIPGGEIQKWLQDRFQPLIANTDESPIETLLKAGVSVYSHILRLEGDESSRSIEPQCVIGPYRVDFIFRGFGAELVVEVDGHDFHEKTKEQVRRDKARDRYLAAEGWTVLRFAGSEVWANPFACAEEIFNVAKRRGSK